MMGNSPNALLYSLLHIKFNPPFVLIASLGKARPLADLQADYLGKYI